MSSKWVVASGTVLASPISEAHIAVALLDVQLAFSPSLLLNILLHVCALKGPSLNIGTALFPRSSVLEVSLLRMAAPQAKHDVASPGLESKTSARQQAIVAQAAQQYHLALSSIHEPLPSPFRHPRAVERPLCCAESCSPSPNGGVALVHLRV